MAYTIDERLEVIETSIVDSHEDARKLYKAMDDLRQEIYAALERARADVDQAIREHLHAVASEAHRIVADKVAANLKPAVVAELLATKSVLVTRPATREELKAGEAVPVRQATPAELRK